MLTNFSVAVSIIEDIDNTYIYKYVNNSTADLFKIDASEFINKPLGFSYKEDYKSESNFYSFVDTFFKSGKKELHTIIPIQHYTTLIENAKLLGIAPHNDVVQFYIIGIRTEPNRAVFIAALEPFVTTSTNGKNNINGDSLLLINKLDAELERIKKTLYYGNGVESFTTRINNIDIYTKNLGVNIKDLQDKVEQLEETKIEQLEETTYWLSVIIQIMKGKWLWVILLSASTIVFTFDLDKSLTKKIIIPLIQKVLVDKNKD